MFFFCFQEGYEEEVVAENSKLKRNNFCIICLGLFEDKTIEEAKKQVKMNTVE